jgi:signal transduction histidine kinase
VLIGAINVVFGVIVVARWHFSPWVMLLVYAGFQFFAAYAAHAVRRADESANELRQVNAHLVATRLLLAESTRDTERLRLSRELHDVSGHKLTALKLNLTLLARDAEVAQRRELQTARSLVDELLHDIRGVVAQLRHHDGIDLREAITKLAEPLPFAQVHVHVDEDARVNDAERAEALIRLAQEGLTNAAKHASSPQNVWLHLTREQDLLQLVVEDDGRLVDPVHPGHGLTGMRERVTALGGELEFGVAKAGGMRICARLPRGEAA